MSKQGSAIQTRTPVMRPLSAISKAWVKHTRCASSHDTVNPLPLTALRPGCHAALEQVQSLARSMRMTVTRIRSAAIH